MQKLRSHVTNQDTEKIIMLMVLAKKFVFFCRIYIFLSFCKSVLEMRMKARE